MHVNLIIRSKYKATIVGRGLAFSPKYSRLHPARERGTIITETRRQKVKNTFERIYDVVRRIPRGKVATYGQVALMAGNHRWSRVVGYALHVNPEPGVIPCHRVVNRCGEPSVAFAFGGINEQILLLQDEGVEIHDGKVDLAKYQWDGK